MDTVIVDGGRGRFFAFPMMLSLIVMTIGCGTAGEAVRPPGPEAEFYSRLYQLSRVCEARDVDRLAAFHAAEATAVTPGQPDRKDDGLPAIRATAAGAFARVRTLRVVLTDSVQVRLAGARTTTTQGFHAEWETVDGARWVWDGRQVATWENREGRHLIVHEELLESPILLSASPAKGADLAPPPAERQASPPEPAAVQASPPPAPRVDQANRAEGPVEGAPPPEPVQAARPSRLPPPPPVPAKARAQTFETSDWTGEPVFVVHFGSSKVRKLAEAQAADLAKKTGMPFRAVQVDLGEKGIWFRSVGGEFRTLPEALEARESLLAKGVTGVGFVYRMTSSR